MNRKSLREFTHLAAKFLDISDSNYKQWVFRYTFLELEKDLTPLGDMTTSILFKKGRHIEAKVVANADGIMAGVDEVKYFLIYSDPKFKPSIKGSFDLSVLFTDGESFKKGDILLTLSGDVLDVLAVERVLLNFLTRVVSVATNTRKLVDKLMGFDILIAPTRKTLWGLVDKRAVFVGGGGTHRLNLSDAVMVKDSHLDLLERDFAFVLGRISSADSFGRFVEIEVENANEAFEVAKLFNSWDCKSVGVVMFDNMPPSDIRASIDRIKAAGFYESVLFEASGGIDNDSLLDYAETGIDIISMGALTSGVVPNVDLRMEVV